MIIKIEKEDLEKLVNKLSKTKGLKIDFKKFTYIFLLCSVSVFSQLTEKKKTYVVGEVLISLNLLSSPAFFILKNKKLPSLKAQIMITKLKIKLPIS